MGYCSRAQAADLIAAGRVRLNGAVRRNPEAPARLEQDQIEVDGRKIGAAKKTYWMLNKPRGVVTSASDEKGRETVYDYIQEGRGWLAPVGRLDKASEGLLLLTNDSEWAARITGPETHIDKTYHVQISKVMGDDFVQMLLRGVKAKNGEVLLAKKVRPLRAGQKNCWLEIVLDEGKNRHIRRMMEAMDVEVIRLARVAIGPLHLGDLAKGACRALTAAEKKMLDHAMREKSS